MEKTLQVHIPPGVDSGSKLRLVREGESGRRGGEPGDLYVFIHVRPHRVFVRSGNDLICEVPVPFHTAALGGIVSVPTFSGAAKMKIPEGTQDGARLRIKGKGVPALRGGGRGDLNIIVHVEIPTGLSGEQKKQLQSFCDSLNSKNYPRRKAFENAAGNFLQEDQ